MSLWVAAHDDLAVTGNVAMSSPDAAVWTQQNTPITDSGWTVAFGAGLFVMGFNFAGTVEQIATSPDGITWTARNSPADNHGVTKIIYGGGQFVALYVSSGGSTQSVMTSPDGITWTSHAIPSPNNQWRGLTFAQNMYVATATTGSFTTSVMSSPDGITWGETATTTDPGDWNCVAFGAGTWVAMGGPNGVAGIHLWTSPDAITWTSHATVGGSNSGWTDVVFAGGQFVAVAPLLGANHVATSPDGLTWTLQAAPDRQWEALGAGGGLYVAVANDNADSIHAVMSSADAITWTLQSTPAAPFAHGVTFSGAAIPTPVISSISPNTVTAHAPSFTLSVIGTGFISGGGGSVVNWNGSALATTFISSTALTAIVPTGDIALPGTASITVFNSGGGGTSNALILSILANLYQPAGGSSFAGAGCRLPKNRWDQSMEQEAVKYSQIHIPGFCTIPERYKNLLPWEDDFGAVPFQSKVINQAKGIVTPAPAAGDQVMLQYQVPHGYFGFLSGFFFQYSGIGFVPGSGDIIFRIRLNQRYLKDLSNVLFALGSTRFPVPMTQGQVLLSDQVIQAIVNVPNLSGLIQVGASTCYAGLFGFLWPYG